MQNDVATTRYYNILIKNSPPSPAKAAEPPLKPTASPAVSLRPTAASPKNAMNDSPLPPGSRAEGDDSQESLALRLFTQKTTELNQLVTELKSKLADAESERQTLKLQAKLVYGLVSEIKSLRAITNTSSNEDNLIALSAATQGRTRNRKKGRRLKEWKDSLVIACLLMSTVAAATFVMENIPQRPHSLSSLR